MDRLKAETSGAHELTESIPFSAAMVQGRLPLESYVGQLAAYSLVHEALDDALAASTHPAVKAVWRDDLAKAPLLAADLRHFASQRDSVPAEAMQVARAFAGWISGLAIASPVALLGVLYVLEGSTLGATILRQHIARAYGLTGTDGLAYYSPYGNKVMPHWKEFKERMNGAVTDANEQQQVLAAADGTFQRVGDILRALSRGL